MDLSHLDRLIGLVENGRLLLKFKDKTYAFSPSEIMDYRGGRLLYRYPAMEGVYARKEGVFLERVFTSIDLLGFDVCKARMNHFIQNHVANKRVLPIKVNYARKAY